MSELEKLHGELLSAKSLLAQREAEYCQARIDLAACERKLASAENAATYWEQRALMTEAYYYEKSKEGDSRD